MPEGVASESPSTPTLPGRVWLRVSAADCRAACELLSLPRNVGEVVDLGDPVALCVAPECWLLLSDRTSSEEVIASCSAVLSGLVFVGADASSQLVQIELEGAGARVLLAMGTGIDTDLRELGVGSCRACLFARMPIIVYCVDAQRLLVLVDRSVHDDLLGWLDYMLADPGFAARPVRLGGQRSS